tara:strand:+ start:1671 stop:2213 length:543 start_codon:yes stop_codon:yes gene_type:complete
MKNYIILFLIFVGCKKIDENGFKTYTIKQGNHKSNYGMKFTRSNCLNFQVIFDSSAIYTTTDPINQFDINKLYGLSDCGDFHTESSIRIGWRWLNDSLELHWFKHDGNFEFDKIKCVDLNTIINCSIQFTDAEYKIVIDNTQIFINRPCPRSNNSKYYTWPYFGGTETAPHDIKIKIKSI